MNWNKIIVLVIIVIALSCILAITSLAQNIFHEQAAYYLSQAQRESGLTQQIAVKNEYENQLLKILQSVKTPEDLQTADQQLLNLKVPSKYQQLHLSLYNVIDDLVNQRSDKAQVKTRLDELQKTYLWLGASLSYFIANNF